MSYQGQYLGMGYKVAMSYASANSVGYVAASAFGILACMDDLDVQVGVFVEDLLDATVVTALLGLDPA